MGGVVATITAVVTGKIGTNPGMGTATKVDGKTVTVVNHNGAPVAVNTVVLVKHSAGDQWVITRTFK